MSKFTEHYLKVNIIDKVSSLYGTGPWYYYLKIMFEAPSLIIGFMIVFSIVYLLITDYKNIILWCIFPFWVVHSIIPHKELRFLFPLVNFIPILLIWTDFVATVVKRLFFFSAVTQLIKILCKHRAYLSR